MALVIQRTARYLGGKADVRAQFRIGDNVIISIIGVKGMQVRIAIEAPRGVAVHREEVYQALRREVGPDRPVPAHP